MECDLAARDGLDRVAEGEGVGDRGDALGALGQQHAVGRRHPGEPVRYAAVLVEHAHVQVRDRLARRLDRVLDRLQHPGADGAMRDREDPVTLDVPGQRVLLRRAGPDEGRQPWVPFRDDAEAVVDDPFVPERRAEPRGERGIAHRTGRQRRFERVDAPGRLPFPPHSFLPHRDVRGQDQRAAAGPGREQPGEPVPGPDPGGEFVPQGAGVGLGRGEPHRQWVPRLVGQHEHSSRGGGRGTHAPCRTRPGRHPYPRWV